MGVSSLARLRRLQDEPSRSTCVAFVIGFVQGVFRHTLQEQLKNGGGVLLAVMAEHMRGRVAPEHRETQGSKLCAAASEQREEST